MRTTVVRLVTAGLAATLGAGVLAAGGGGRAEGAAGYPTRPITILVGFSAGATVDVEARLFAQGLREQLHQPVVVVDAVGGSGGIALEQLAERPADGYTLLFATRSLSFLLASGQTRFTLNDLVGVARLNGEASALFVRRDSPYRTLADLVRYAKDNPGKLTIAGAGAVAITHQVEAEFVDAAGIRATYVPFAGGGDVVTAVLGGHVDAGMAAASNARPSADAGTMRYLALSAKRGYAPMPSAPTFEQFGYPVAEYVWRGLLARAGVPAGVLATLSAAANAVRATPAWDVFARQDGQVDLYLDAPSFQSYLAKEIAATTDIAKRLAQESK
ncbi:MAG TPA: tripartite tricarboxylate transporter substrate binding protein [bacterium]|nr:tripartite tricarboxylate transporter substrate binding protein [bacterium]